MAAHISGGTFLLVDVKRGGEIGLISSHSQPFNRFCCTNHPQQPVCIHMSLHVSRETCRHFGARQNRTSRHRYQQGDSRIQLLLVRVPRYYLVVRVSTQFTFHTKHHTEPKDSVAAIELIHRVGLIDESAYLLDGLGSIQSQNSRSCFT